MKTKLFIILTALVVAVAFAGCEKEISSDKIFDYSKVDKGNKKSPPVERAETPAQPTQNAEDNSSQATAENADQLFEVCKEAQNAIATKLAEDEVDFKGALADAKKFQENFEKFIQTDKIKNEPALEGITAKTKEAIEAVIAALEAEDLAKAQETFGWLGPPWNHFNKYMKLGTLPPKVVDEQPDE